MNNDIWSNIPLWSAVISCLVAQLLKPLFDLIAGHGFSWHSLITTGGMPSSHTSSVVALTTAIACTEGVGSVSFAVSLVFSLIVMNDAMNIRWEAGKQAKVINEWSHLLADIHQNGPFTPTNLKTLLGHSFSQVFAGLILGLIVGFAVPALCAV